MVGIRDTSEINGYGTCEGARTDIPVNQRLHEHEIRTNPHLLPSLLVKVEDGMVRGEVQRSGGRTPALCAQDFLNLRLVSL